MKAADIEAGRRQLATELGLKPEELRYIGPQEVITGKVALSFNVEAPGHPLNYSTRSVRLGG